MQDYVVSLQRAMNTLENSMPLPPLGEHVTYLQNALVSLVLVVGFVVVVATAALPLCAGSLRRALFSSVLLFLRFACVLDFLSCIPTTRFFPLLHWHTYVFSRSNLSRCCPHEAPRSIGVLYPIHTHPPAHIYTHTSTCFSLIVLSCRRRQRQRFAGRARSERFTDGRCRTLRSRHERCWSAWGERKEVEETRNSAMAEGKEVVLEEAQ